MPKIDFNNTSIAFHHKTNGDLKKAWWLFNSFNYPFIVNVGPKMADFAFSLHLPIKGMVKSTIFAQFCGGENIEECTVAIRSLTQSNIGTILDYSVEGEESEKVFDATCNEIIATIHKAAGNHFIPFSVFKTTGIGRFNLMAKVNSKLELNNLEEAEFSRLKVRFEKICQTAYDKKVRVFVDAEETWIQDTIDKLTYSMMMKFNQETAIVYNTIQCYRKDRVAHLQNAVATLDCKLGFKLVRGAYMEKERERALAKGMPSPIQNTKELTDKEFNAVMTICIQHIDKVSICAGTHNEESSQLLVDLIEQYNLQPNDQRIYFAQLLGMSDHISFNLANAGYNVAKYVPYGPVRAVLPYLSRRAQENSSVKGQVGRELRLITEELTRRGKN
jgi:proline dehydrogenase